ncbi:hypothetical protein CAEBREN_25193 [Caenorhabditis brenneri]|uniref:Uncharacterized protein n=1 Tax=Caenorhabditis brenneri TaxID=135651 RepID=G0MMP9_CAEBE|nr:hypothetical protein CAEBREN_25193 [Caenorhabditis brenneri]
MDSSSEDADQRINWKRPSSDSGCEDSEAFQIFVASVLEQATNLDSIDVQDETPLFRQISPSSHKQNGSFKRKRDQLPTRPTKQNAGGPKELKMNLEKIQDKNIFAEKLQKIAKTYYDQNKLLHQDFSEARQKLNKWWDVMEDLELEGDATTMMVIQKLRENYDRRCQPGWTKKKEKEFLEAQEKSAIKRKSLEKLQNEIVVKNDQIQQATDTATELKKALSEEQNKTSSLSNTVQKLSEENSTLIIVKKSLETEKKELTTQLEALSIHNSNLDKVNVELIRINVLLTKKIEEEQKKTADNAEKLEKERNEMMEFLELKNQRWKKGAEALVAAKKELVKEQEEFETKKKNYRERLAKKRKYLENGRERALTETMISLGNPKEKLRNTEQEKLSGDETKLEAGQQNLAFQHPPLKADHQSFLLKDSEEEEFVIQEKLSIGVDIDHVSIEENKICTATGVERFEENQLETKRWKSEEKEMFKPPDKKPEIKNPRVTG